MREAFDRSFPTAPKKADTAEAWRDRQATAWRWTRSRALDSRRRPDGVDSYVVERRRWEPLIQRVAPSLGYCMEVIDWRPPMRPKQKSAPGTEDEGTTLLTRVCPRGRTRTDRDHRGLPGEKLTNFDISFVDQASGLYYLADRSNKAIDIFDTKSDTYWAGRGLCRRGHEGRQGRQRESGPDGVLFTGKEIWAGDGDSTVKVIDPATQKTTATISTGGKTRLDEMAVDFKDQAFIGVNNAEDPPYATVMSTNPDHAMIGKIVFPNATDGAEQPAYNPDDGIFYMSIPEIDKDPKKGRRCCD